MPDRYVNYSGALSSDMCSPSIARCVLFFNLIHEIYQKYRSFMIAAAVLVAGARSLSNLSKDSIDQLATVLRLEAVRIEANPISS
jgi:hypothetical protein